MKTEHKTNLTKRIITFGIVMLLFFNIKYIQLVPVAIFHITKISDEISILLSTFSNIIFILILIFIYKNELKREWKIFIKDLWKNIDCGLKFWLLGLAGMMISNVFIQIIMSSGQANNEQMVQEMIKTLPWLMLINAGVIAPIIEELCFRKTFHNVFSNKWVFILISGFVFGGLHVITSMTSLADLLYIIPYTSLGIVFAYMYYKTKTVFTSIMFHMVHNTILTLISIILL